MVRPPGRGGAPRGPWTELRVPADTIPAPSAVPDDGGHSRALNATRRSHHTGPLVHHGCLSSWSVPPPRTGNSLLGPRRRVELCAMSPTAAQLSCHPRMDDGLSQGETQSPRENPSAPNVKDTCTGHGTRAHACAHTPPRTQHASSTCALTRANTLVPTCTHAHVGARLHAFMLPRAHTSTPPCTPSPGVICSQHRPCKLKFLS